MTAKKTYILSEYLTLRSSSADILVAGLHHKRAQDDIFLRESDKKWRCQERARGARGGRR